MDFTLFSLILERFVKKHGFKMTKFFIGGEGRSIYVPNGKGWTLKIAPPDELGRTTVTLHKLGYGPQDVHVAVDAASLENVLEALLAQALERDRAGKDIEYSVYDKILDRVCARHNLEYFKLNHENEEIRNILIYPVKETRAQPRRHIALAPPDAKANTIVHTDRKSSYGKFQSFPADLNTLEDVLDDCIIAVKKELGLI